MVVEYTALLLWRAREHCCCDAVASTAVVVVVVVVRTFELLGALQLDAGQRSGEQLRGTVGCRAAVRQLRHNNTTAHTTSQHYTLYTIHYTLLCNIMTPCPPGPVHNEVECD